MCCSRGTQGRMAKSTWPPEGGARAGAGARGAARLLSLCEGGLLCEGGVARMGIFGPGGGAM